MTHCRTGCGAEINYKRVHFSSPVDWYDIPMEGDVIHDCPKLKPSTNDAANDVLKELEFMHKTLHEYFLDQMVMEYGLVEYSDLIDLPQELKMHSKEKLAERIIRKEDIHNHHMGGEMPREDFDKLPKSEKDDYKEFFGVEPSNQTPEERQADFRRTINFVISFLQRCTDRFPAPFYRYGGYSQLELFRIFLESTEQYSDAVICHTIHCALLTAKNQVGVSVAAIGGRLIKKYEDQRLANKWTPEDTLAEKNRLVRQGMDEKEAESEAEFSRYHEETQEELEQNYPSSIMSWALDQYKKEFDKSIEENKQDDALEHDREQIEVGDTAVKEQSAEELLKPHSQEYFGDIHKRLREFILRLHDGKIIWAELGADGKFIYDQIQTMKNKQSKTSYTMANRSDLGVATLGQLVAILRNPETAKKAKQEGISEYESVVDQCKVVLSCRNNMDHDERKELPPGWKIANAGLCTILNEFFDNLKYR